jgi:hypothetical protein
MRMKDIAVGKCYRGGTGELFAVWATAISAEAKGRST